MAVSPHRKKINIHTRNILDRCDAPANSRHTKTPHAAEIMVAPCPIEYEIAGPTICAREATKLSTAPVHQIAPPATPHRCQEPRAFQ